MGGTAKGGAALAKVGIDVGSKGLEAMAGLAKGGKLGSSIVGKAADGTRVGDAELLGANTAARLDQATSNSILSIEKGMRPDPSTYLSPSYISEHLAEFDNGASRFMTEGNLNKYGIGQRDGTSFVMPSQEANSLLESTGGNARALEKALGLPENFLETNKLVRVDIPKPGELNLRIPSGNEVGANVLWIPGGRLSNGNLEAVIDVGGVPTGRYHVTPLPTVHR